MNSRNIIKFTKDITTVKFFNYRLPLRVTHNITYRCNLACPFCLLKELPGSCGNPEMNTSQIKIMMQEFKEMGTRFWLFSGGEPLLRQDIGELISYAKEKMNFHCSLSTNGTLFTERMKNDLCFKQLDFVQISLEGPKEIQDRLCGIGIYDKIIAALNTLEKLRIKTAIMVLILKDNLNHLDFLIKLATQYNAHIVFQVIGNQPAAEAGLRKTSFPDIDKFKEAIEGLAEKVRKDRNRRIISSPGYLKMVKNCWPNLPHDITCYAGRLYCEITPDGFVAPCCAKLNTADDNCNGLKMGFKKAFIGLNNMSGCQGCYYAGPQESNIIFSMFPSRIATLYRDYFHTIQSILK